MKYRTGKLLAALAVGALLFLAQPVSASAASFTDVPSGAWYSGYVTDLVGKGVVHGTSSTTFSPDRELTRGAFVTMLANTVLTKAELEQYAFQGKFTDVTPGHWANRAVNWAAEAGVVNGYGDKTFRPDKPVSRQEMAVMAVKFAAASGRKIPEGKDEAAFTDSGTVAAFAASSVAICRKAGIISGYKDGTFRPNGSATRAEAAALYSKFLKKCGPGDFTILRKRVLNTPVRAVEVDPSVYRGGLILGKDLVDGSESAASLVARSGARVAVNAAFFDLNTYMPLGTLISDERVITVADGYAPYKPSLVMTAAGKFSIRNFATIYTVHTTRENVKENTLKGVTLNKWPSGEKDAARILFTRDWGHTLCFPAKDAVTVDENGVVIAVDHDKDVTIPEKGYVLAQRAHREYEGDFFSTCQVGDKLEIRQVFQPLEGTTLPEKIVLSIGTGPRIVKGGAVYGNADTYRAEGFTEYSVVSSPRMKLCVGIKPDGKLLILGAETTLAHLSEIMVSLGCTDAINLDGGTSSALYVDGTWLFGPGRSLNNMLYFK